MGRKSKQCFLFAVISSRWKLVNITWISCRYFDLGTSVFFSLRFRNYYASMDSLYFTRAPRLSWLTACSKFVLKENVIHGAVLPQTSPRNHIFLQSAPWNNKKCVKSPGQPQQSHFFNSFLISFTFFLHFLKIIDSGVFNIGILF